MYSTMKEMQPFTRGGIGSKDAELIKILYADPHALTDRIGEKLTSSHLDKLEVVEIVHDHFDTADGKDKKIYFMADGSVKKLSIEELLVKSSKELKYVHYLLRVKNQVTR